VGASTGSDELRGGDGNDHLITSNGADILDGGAGDDLLEDRSGGQASTNTTYVFGRGYGHDTIDVIPSAFSASKIELLAGVDPSDVSLTRSGADLVLSIAGDAGSLRVLAFFQSAEAYEVSAGMFGNIDFADGTRWDRTRVVNLVRASEGSGPSPGDDVLLGTPDADTIDALAGNDSIYGDAGNDSLTGGDGADDIRGEAGDDTLIGGVGNDLLSGGPGADSYRFATGSGADVIDDSQNVAQDTAIDEIVFEAGIAPEDIEVLFGPSFPYVPDLLIRNAVTGDTITVRRFFATEVGYTGGDKIERIRFADGTVWNESEIAARAAQLVGTEGDDTLQSQLQLDTRLFGLGGNDYLTSANGNDLLDGGAGDDWMFGGVGDDTYEVDSIGDTVVENQGEGTDLVRSSVSWTLGAQVENLTLTGSAAINATGNSLVNVLTGNSANNTLDGKAGADTAIGGAGDDTYVIDNVGDVIIENAGEGTDLVQSSVTYSLQANVENLTLTGSGAINATGNELANALTGNSGANVLDGGEGADSMAGGTGNDTYFVDNAGDTITENSSAGTDHVRSSITYALGSNLENLTLIGTANLDGTGNSSSNTITGNDGANVLDGGTSGTDVLVGGVGDDTYVVGRTSGITITEGSNQGTDTVRASVTYTLSSNLENLMLTGSGAINGTGNSASNVLTGNSGNNTLDGGTGDDTLDGGSAGTDTLRGGTGNDTFIVARSSGITITENSGAGTDTVQSSVTYTLGSNLENLTLTGSSAINGTGNSAANVISGNSAANTLDGGSGNDTLNGFGGNDALTGGLGADIYQYTSGGGADTINNVASDSLIDRLQFTDLSSTQITFSRTGNNLVMTSVGTPTDTVTVTNWFSATANRLDFVDFTNRQVTAAEIDTLVNGGGGSFPMGFGGPTAMSEPVTGAQLRQNRLNELLGDYAAPLMDETSSSPAAMFDREMTLGGSYAEKGRRVWTPIKPFVDRRTEVGVSRLVDALSTFGVDPVMDGFGPADAIDRSALLDIGIDGGLRRTLPIRGELRALAE
jgi:Ca2+-binding RTX toxin-like protein